MCRAPGSPSPFNAQEPLWAFDLASLWPPDVCEEPDSLEKTLMLGKIEGGRRRGRQGMRWLDGIADSVVMSLSNSGRPGVLHSMGLQRVGRD